MARFVSLPSAAWENSLWFACGLNEQGDVGSFRSERQNSMNAKSTMPTDPVDRDDGPRITADWAARAELRDGDTIVREASPQVRIGRPPKPDAERKRQVTLRIDPMLLDSMRASGKGWQSRVEDVLRSEFLGKKSRTKTSNSVGRKLADHVTGITAESPSRVKSTGQMLGVARRAPKARKSA